MLVFGSVSGVFGGGGVLVSTQCVCVCVCVNGVDVAVCFSGGVLLVVLRWIFWCWCLSGCVFGNGVRMVFLSCCVHGGLLDARSYQKHTDRNTKHAKST